MEAINTTTPETVEEVPAQDTSFQNSPEVQAAMFLHRALPMFRIALDKLTGVQAKRVLSALMEAPLEKETPGFSTQEAEELFSLGLMISNAKFILFNVSLKDKELTDKMEEEAKVAGAADASEENKGE